VSEFEVFVRMGPYICDAMVVCHHGYRGIRKPDIVARLIVCVKLVLSP
jgi:hypothetical protein